MIPEDNFRERMKNQEPDHPVSGNSSPDWNRLYAEVNVKDMPWYLPELDPDLGEALNKLNIHSGSFLDLGTGPGTQAIELSKRGFEVTGSDISAEAIQKVSKLNDKVKFVQDNILNSRIENQFDYILDRGCFHIIDPLKRQVYVSEVEKLLRKDGLLFLKCFSDKNLNTGYGPNHISRLQIKEIFGGHFNILHIKDSIYHSTSSRQKNQTLFVVMKKRNNLQ